MQNSKGTQNKMIIDQNKEPIVPYKRKTFKIAHKICDNDYLSSHYLFLKC